MKDESSKIMPPSPSQAVKKDAIDLKAEEERVVQGLINRGFLSMEEVARCIPDGSKGGAGYLQRVQAAGLVTAGQFERLKADLQLLSGQQIPGYVMMEKLGQGAMGVVYKARQIRLDRLVAIKILRGKLASDPDSFVRLEREARLAAKLSHNNIIQAIDVGIAGKLKYFVMELIQGKTIQEEMKAGKARYPEKQAVEIILQIAQALEHANKRGLVHRDIKPANIVLTGEGVAKLADLGMARENTDVELIKKEQGMIIGTPYYIAPEQVRGEPDIDTRADIYSLGATLYHMVVGSPPFEGESVMQVLKAHESEELQPPDHIIKELSSGIGEVVEMMMAKSREDRYRTASELIIDLECLLNGEPPKLARKKISASLAGLSQGEEEEAAQAVAELPNWVYICFAVLGGGLVLSLAANMVLALKK
ncbi:MAG: serine/threonine protein kinase [Gemmataceae bacterium]|nr:serine/threonine protein kinase [Gemmataceae bacterium]